MFGVMPAIQGGTFEWSGDFSKGGLPTSHAELVEWLGVDGSVSPDITGDADFGSHLWLAEDNLPADVGTLADLSMTGRSAGANIITDGDFGASRNVQKYAGNQDLNTHTNGDVPAAPDGGTSLMVGVVGKMHADSAGDNTRNIISQYSSGGGAGAKGWYLRTAVSLNNRIGFSIDWGTTVTTAWGATHHVAGDIFFAIGVLDFAAGTQRILDETGNEVSTTPTGGSFDSGGIALETGYNANANWDGFEFQWPLIFTLEWSDAIDAEFGVDNITRFLKYADGILG